jgi:transcriptional regulator with XRE-family HTH domain
MSELLDTQVKDAPRKLIASRIRRARRHADLTLDALGEKVGTSRHHLIRLERGDHRPRLDMLQRIATATGKPLDYFLLEAAGEPNPFPDEQAA